MTSIIDIPFNDGQDESADKVFLPEGKFRLIQDMRLDRDGRLEVRPGYRAINMNDPDVGDLTAADITTYRGRLIALSSRGSFSQNPAHISAYVSPAAERWETVPAGPFPAFSEVTHIWQNPSGNAARQFDVAYANGQLCVVQCDDSNVLTIVRMLTDGTELMRTQVSPISSARVIAVSNTFVLCTRGTTGTMAVRTFDTTATTNTFSSATTLEATVATGTAHWDLAPITGSTTDYLITYPRPGSNNTRIRRYTQPSTLVATRDYTRVTSVGDSACAAVSTSSIYWLVIDGTDLIEHTLNGSLVIQTGPTVRSSTSTKRAPGISVGPAGEVWEVCNETALVTSFVISPTGSLGDSSAPNVTSASKPLPLANGITGGACYLLGTIDAGGNTGSALQFYTTCLYDASLPSNIHGTWDYGISDPLDLSSTSNTGGRSTIATDGTYYYALSGRQRGLEVGASVPGGLRLTKFRRGQQRQCIEVQGSLYISGGAPVVFDGAVLSTASFQNVPKITAVTEDASGSQTALATYQYVAMYEYIDATGATVRSTPSDPYSFTLTGANDRAIVTVSHPRTAKFGLGITTRIILYRNTPGDSVFFRVAESGDLSGVDCATATTINDGLADATAETREVLYIQAQKPTANVAPQPCQFMAVGRDRVILGGLPDPYVVALSQLVFPAEPVEFASPNAFAYQARLPEPVTAVEAYGDSYIAFTADAIYAIPGAGPQRNGSGEFFPPQALYSDGGCINYRSVVSCGEGTFFQLAADKLYVLRPGGGAEWIGQPVRDTLASFPDITGAALCSDTQRIVWSCRNTAGSDGRLLIYDLRRKVWYVDNAIAAPKAVTEYDGRLAVVDSVGTIRLEDEAVGTVGAGFPNPSVRTGSFKLFKAGGYGTLVKVTLIGTYVGDSTIEGFISYDDGVTWTSMGTFAATAADQVNPVTGNALASGDPVCAVFTPAAREVDRFALRFDMTNGGTNSGATRLHMMSLEVEGQLASTRQPARNQR
jgi:hypothetical protein